MSDTLGYYYPRLRLIAPGVPEMLLGDAVLRAMGRIARDTRAFRKDVADEDWVDGTATYALSIDGFKIIDFSEVFFEEDTTEAAKSDDDLCPLTRITHREMHMLLNDNETSPRPTHWAHTAAVAGSIDLYPFDGTTALTDAVIQARAVVVPIRPAAEGSVIDPDTAHWGASSFFDIAEETILNLAAGYMLDMPGKPWSNRTAAGDYKNQAGREIDILKSLADDDMRPGKARAVKYGGY